MQKVANHNMLKLLTGWRYFTDRVSSRLFNKVLIMWTGSCRYPTLANRKLDKKSWPGPGIVEPDMCSFVNFKIIEPKRSANSKCGVHAAF